MEGNKSLPLAEEVLAANSCWEKESVSFTGVAPSSSTMFQSRLHTQEYLGIPN